MRVADPSAALQMPRALYLKVHAASLETLASPQAVPCSHALCHDCSLVLHVGRVGKLADNYPRREEIETLL